MRWLTVYLVGFVTVCASIVFGLQHANAARVTWSVADGGNGHEYEAFDVPGDGGISWTDARDAAISKGGYLASAATAAENTFVFDLVSNATFWNVVDEYSYGPWLGGYQYDKQAEPAGHWAWLSGDLWDYTNWAITNQGGQEPNNGGDVEDYLGYINFEPGGSGLHMASTWNDYMNYPTGNSIVHSYVVEYVPEPSTLALFGAGAVSLVAYIWRRRKPTA